MEVWESIRQQPIPWHILSKEAALFSQLWFDVPRYGLRVRLKLEFYWISESIGGGSANRNSASRGYIGEAVELFLEVGRRTSSSAPSAPCRIALTNKREPRLTNLFLINHSIYYRCWTANIINPQNQSCRLLTSSGQLRPFLGMSFTTYLPLYVY